MASKSATDLPKDAASAASLKGNRRDMRRADDSADPSDRYAPAELRPVSERVANFTYGTTEKATITEAGFTEMQTSPFLLQDGSNV